MSQFIRLPLRSMLFLVSVVFFIFSFPVLSQAKVSPANGSTLNYRIIAFKFPVRKEATEYVVEIAEGKIISEKYFDKKVMKKADTKSNSVIVEVPSFGTSYTWRIVYRANNSVISTTGLFHFSTGQLPVDSNFIKRIRVERKAQKHADGYFFVDGFNLMFDMDGKPVWYFPYADTLGMELDIKATDFGSISFLSKTIGYEVNYDGRVLWKATNKGHVDGQFYGKYAIHHELTKRSNGNFFGLTAQMETPGNAPLKEGERKRFFPMLRTSKLAEFGKDGSIIWTWDCNNYVQQSDLNELQQQGQQAQLDLHENAFTFDEKNSVFYVGMSAINRIVKIQYPSGKVLNEYGNKVSVSKSENATIGYVKQYNRGELFNNGIFSHQHALKSIDEKYIYIYNNNLHSETASEKVYPEILKMKFDGDDLEEVWRFECRQFDVGDQSINGGGGNLQILSDGSLFVSMCNPYSQLFIVDSNKSILWRAIAETYNQADKTWKTYNMYRASFVTRQQLEKMIWSK